MKKRLLGILLVLCMVLAVMPLAVGAADGNPVYLDPISGSDSNDGLSEATAVQSLTTAVTMAGEGGTIYILNQVSITGSVRLRNVTFERRETFKSDLFSVGSGAELTLNNVTIDGGEIASVGNLVDVNGGTLTIGIGTKLINNMNSAVYAYNSMLNLNGGEISNNTADYGGGIDVTGGTLNLSGCTISNNTANYDGGGIYAYNCKLNLTDGNISGNYAAGGGGGILASGGSLILNGANIQSNTAGWGGGLYVYNCTTTLSGGKISDNEADDTCGGGIFVGKSSVKLMGTVIQNNISAYAGAGIYMESFEGTAELIMTGGSVVDNKTYDGQGGGIFAAISGDEETATVKVSGGKITGNYINWEGEYPYEDAIILNDYYDEYYEPDVNTAFASLELSGSPEISGDITLVGWDGYGPQIKVTGEFTPAAPVEVGSTYGNYLLVVFDDGLEPSAENFSAGLNHAFVVDGNGLKVVDLIPVRFHQCSSGTDGPYTEVYVYPDQPINPEVIPAAAGVPGYRRTGWLHKVGDDWVDWDMTANVTDKLELHEKWERISVTGVTLDKTALTLTEGETAQLTATVSPADALDPTVTWSSDKESVATVSPDGLVTAVAPGTAKITVTTADGSFTATCTVTVEAVPDEPCDGGENCPSKPYFDVNQEAWYHEHVDFVIKNGYMIGTSDDPLTFSTEKPVTRAQVVQTLYQMEGEPTPTKMATYPDLNTKAWYMDAISWATENGIVEGRDTGVFDPDVNITREELVAVIYRYVKEYKGLSVDTADGIPSTYTDSAKVGSFAEAPFAWAINRGIIDGITDTTLEPQTNARRCEMAKIISMLCKAYPEIP